jgi:tRNASer (uridine44-2'-O)-methyltransferase
MQLIEHPEYNSTLILRSATVSDSESDFPPELPRLRDHSITRNIFRRLLPRRPGRDAGISQHCTICRHESLDLDDPTTMVFTPSLEPGTQLPYYHPAVHHIAFRYIPLDHSESSLLRIEAVPIEGTPLDLSSRLYRTCLSLLDTLHRYCWGALTNYKKRVILDRLVPREEYQDLYLVMRERHKGMVGQWQESTDPLKHVFEVSRIRAQE